MSQPDCIVAGAGLIGLSITWRLAGAGLRVTVVDPRPGRGASHAAAGMLAPVTEVHYGEEPLLGLNLESARRYPGFVAELEEETGRSVGYRPCGTLVVAADNDDRLVLSELQGFQRSLGLKVEGLTSRECRQVEPALAPTVRGGLRVAGDHQVDPRALTAALLSACDRAGVDLRRTAVTSVVRVGDRVGGVSLADGDRLDAPLVVLATGAWSADAGGLPVGARPPIRPVKGQILRLRDRGAAPLLNGNVRGFVSGSGVYLVPRADGEIVVGATSEEKGFDTGVTAGAVHDLLRDAYALVPGITEVELVETSASLRPCSPDNAPLIGPGRMEGLFLAVGHYRNGVLLTPVTADGVRASIIDGVAPDWLLPFRPDRFPVVAA